jgi:transposase
MLPGSWLGNLAIKPFVDRDRVAGNPYLRKMFIHEARAAVLRVKREGSSLGKWKSGLETRTARNVMIVATAKQTG